MGSWIKVVVGALVFLAGIGGMLYSIFVWMLPGVDVGFLDHGFVAGGMLMLIIGLMVAISGVQELRART